MKMSQEANLAEASHPYMEERVGVGGQGYKKMRQESVSVADVPSAIIIDIISRLPVKTIISCKSVCKSWLNLLTSPEFVKCHLSKSKPGLVFSPYEDDDNVPFSYHVIDFESYSTITVFDLMAFCSKDTSIEMEGSVNGLMSCCMVLLDSQSYFHLICNPITREYIELPRPQERVFESYSYQGRGFGVSKITGQYKIVRVSFDIKNERLIGEVYTLGTGSWRVVPFAPDVPPLEYCDFSDGKFLNGNLHWLANDFEGRCSIFCCDLETELFSIFSTPVESCTLELIASGDCLHLIHYGSNHEVVVWSMKEYGVDGSWTKESVISGIWYSDGEFYKASAVIDVFSNGDVLIKMHRWHLLYYSSKSKTSRVISISELHGRPSQYVGMLHSPSFLSLKSFAMEDVKLF